jgi:transcriptional regulator with XRE-family HTH domain
MVSSPRWRNNGGRTAIFDLTYVGGIERGKRNPSLLVMARVAKALSVPLARLLTE